MTRMTTDVEALSQLLQTGLVNAVVSVFTCVGVVRRSSSSCQPRARARRRSLGAAAAGPRHCWYRRRSARRPTTGPATRIAAVNADLQESLSGVRVAQAYVREDRNIDAVPRRQRRATSTPGSARSGSSPLYFPFVVLLSATSAAVLVLGAGAALDRRNGTRHGRRR